MEYTVTASGTDADGDDILYYEYLFDGQTVEHKNKIKYYSVFQDAQGKWLKSSDKDMYLNETALKGDLIPPTKSSSVKHAFQSIGAHTVAVRCMDKFGCWSEWSKKTINIE